MIISLWHMGLYKVNSFVLCSFLVTECVLNNFMYMYNFFFFFFYKLANRCGDGK